MLSATDIPPRIATWQREALAPVAVTERIETLDVLRGFALLGILTVNIVAFSWPYEYMLWQSEYWDSRADAVVDWLVRFLAEGKFYPLFAFLFGLGAAIQFNRANVKGVSIVRHHCKRMAVLLGFGIVHALLIWDGDILVSYALGGFLLLPFLKRQPKTILFWAGGCILIPALLTILLWALLVLLSLVPEFAVIIQKGLDEYYGSYESQRAGLEASITTFASGTYGDILRERLWNVFFMWLAGIFYLPSILGLFLLGLSAGKTQVFQDVEGHRIFFRRALLWGLGIGLPLNLFHAICMASADLATPLFLWLLSYGLMVIGGPAQTLAYVAALTLALQNERVKSLLRVIGLTGKMALSNYLFQSLLCTTIFYGYGFGLFGAVSRTTSLALVGLIFATQICISICWLRIFQFGPMEWLWRSLTYGSCQPLRR